MFHKQTLKRRDFLSQFTAVGTVVIFGAAAGPLHAVAKTFEAAQPVRGNKPVRLDTAAVEDFSGLVGQAFRLQHKDGAMTSAKLIEATPLTAHGDRRQRRQPFSVVFDVPRGFELAQDHYRINHHRLGTMELFMVPVDLPAKYNRLEAVFT